MLPPHHGRNADGPDVQPARVRRGFRQDKAGLRRLEGHGGVARTATGHGRPVNPERPDGISREKMKARCASALIRATSPAPAA